MEKDHWKNKRVTILGGARQGQAAARFLTRHGATVTINDQRRAEEMVASQTALADLPVHWVLGHHPLELLDKTDILCPSGGIPLDLPIVEEATRRNIPLTNDTQIFLETVPCRTIGITGSAGKSTTTCLVGRIAQAAYQGKTTTVYIGGNIGNPLLNYVDEMKPNDIAILEISSFQLELMTLSPNIAVILNITPNHLDRHGTMKAYTESKARIIKFQTPQDISVLGRDDTIAWSLRDQVKGRLLSFGLSPLPAGVEGTFLQDNIYYLTSRKESISLLNPEAVHLRGDHNQLNVLAACVIAWAAGLDLKAMEAGTANFYGMPHRLEFVRTYKGSNWYNDSIATAPERTIAAIRSFDEPIVLMLGGRDKNLPWKELLALVQERIDHVVLFGEAADKIYSELGAMIPGCRPYSIDKCKGLEHAIQVAARVVKPGDVILFSPGGTSFDEFRDFEERGESFRKWVSDLT